MHSQYETNQVLQFLIKFENAKIAQLVERDLAKVEVAGSSPVFRSKTIQCSDGEIGRHAGAGSSPALSTKASSFEEAFFICRLAENKFAQ